MHLSSSMYAVVTGGASGIGRAIAARCIDRGLTVFLLDVEESALDATVSELGHRANGLRCDVSDRADVEAAAASIGGPVDLLVNNAGVGTYGPPIWELTTADWQWVLGVNLWGTINCLGAFLPKMHRRDQGHVVNVASAAGLMSPPGFGPYNASKHGIVTISETLHHELRRSGANLGVTLALPGMVRTRMPENERNRPVNLMNSTNIEQDRASRYRDAVAAMRRANDSAADPGDIAHAILGAVEENRFYLILDDWIREGMKLRATEIVEGRIPTDPS